MIENDKPVEDKILIELNRIYTDLLENQVDLDDETRKIINDNLWDLWE